MIKLKKLLESKNAFRREFGEPLPTLTDVMDKHQDTPKEVVKEAKLPQLKVPSDVSYYNRDWGDVFEWLSQYRNVEYGPRESDMYDWNDRSNYDKVVKEFNAEMGHVAAVINKAIKPLEKSWKVWNKILEKHRKKDRS